MKHSLTIRTQQSQFYLHQEGNSRGELLTLRCVSNSEVCVL